MCSRHQPEEGADSGIWEDAAIIPESVLPEIEAMRSNHRCPACDRPVWIGQRDCMWCGRRVYANEEVNEDA